MTWLKAKTPPGNGSMGDDIYLNLAFLAQVQIKPDGSCVLRSTGAPGYALADAGEVLKAIGVTAATAPAIKPDHARPAGLPAWPKPAPAPSDAGRS